MQLTKVKKLLYLWFVWCNF